VCERRVDLLVCSLPLHRHSYIGFILGFASSIHNKQLATADRSRVQPCGDIELSGYLANAAGPVPLVLDLRISHECWGSRSDPTLHGNLHYSNDINRSLNEPSDDKIRKYRGDYNNNPPNDRKISR
jgi:hypothetical protein